MRGRRSRIALPLLVALLTLVPGIAAFAPQTARAMAPTDGRLIAVFQVRPVGDGGVTGEALAVLQQAIQQRLRAYGIDEPKVQLQGVDQLVVDLPMSDNTTPITALIAQVGLCEFVGSDSRLDDGSLIATSLGGPEAVGLNPDGTKRDATATGLTVPTASPAPIYETILRGTDIVDARIESDSIGPRISFTLSDTAPQTFSDYTSSHIGQYVSIVMDKRVLSSAIIQGPIGRNVELQGPDLGDLRALVALLRSGPLILPLTLIDIHAP